MHSMYVICKFGVWHNAVMSLTVFRNNICRHL